VIRVVFAVDNRAVQIPTGGSGQVPKGSHWPADDPIVLANPDLFSDDPRWGMLYSVEPDGYDAPVEQTTAAPGERRATRRPPAPAADAASDEAAELRDELTRLGRPVDSRWGLRRLREEMEKVAQ
jgi:hypothetical protein